jgi:selenocysteine-specific elongation factor
VTDLPVRVGIAPADVDRVINDLRGDVARCGTVLVSNDALDELRNRLLSLLREFHNASPLEPGAALEAIRSQLGAGPAVDHVLAAAKASSEVVLDHGILRLASWSPTLSEAQGATLEQLRGVLRSAGREPPDVDELIAAHGGSIPGLLRMLEREGAVVRVDQGRYYDSSVLEGVIAALNEGMEAGREYSPAQLRELLGVSRKFLIPLLEFCDRRRITARVGGGRVLAGK